MNEPPGPTSHRDRGFTLIEIVMAITLSVMLIGTMVGVLITSISATSSNQSRVRDSVDVSLIAAFLYADAQAIGGIDPTAATDNTLGVSITDAQGCTATGLIARFKWVDATGTTPSTYVVNYGLSGNTLTRNECKNGTLADSQVLGRNVASDTFSYSPSNNARLPQTVSMRIIGTGTQSKLDVTLKATVRPSTTAGSSSLGQQAPLLVLANGACPAIDLSTGSQDVTVVGTGVVSVSAGCSTPVVDPNGDLNNPPVISSGITDPLAGTVVPPVNEEGENTDCPNLGHGEGHGDESGLTYFEGFTQVKSPWHLDPGTYVFCNGLSVDAGGSLEGHDVTLIVRNGSGSNKGFHVDPAATVNITAPTTGQYAGIVVWLAFSQPTDIGLEGPVANYSGLIYSPGSVITFIADTNSVSANIGSVIAKQVYFKGAGRMVIGVTPRDISLSPTTLPTAVAGQPYSATISAPGINETAFAAPDLPAGLTINNAGVLSGTAPACDGTQVLGRIVATDGNGAAAGAVYDGSFTSLFSSTTGVTYQPLTVLPGVTVSDPGNWVNHTVVLSAAATNCLKTTKVAFQTAPTGTTNWTNIAGCSAVGSATTNFTCSWTPSTGVNYDLRAAATDGTLSNTSPVVSGVQVDNTAPVIGTVTPATPFTFPGTSTVVAATVTDSGGSGINTVTFSLNGTGTSCTDTIPTVNSYSCDLGTLPANGTYTMTVTATDAAGNAAVKTQSTYTVTNSSLTLAAVPSPVKGSITMTATPVSSHPYNLVWAYSKNGGTSWTTIAGCTTATCTINTATALTGDGSYLFRVQMVETSGQGFATYTQTSGSVAVDNTGPAIGTITPAAPFAFPGASTAVSAIVTDATSGVASVSFQLGSGTPCAGVPSGSTYSCSLDVSGMANGSSYILTVTAKDGAGNQTTTTQSTYTVTNSGLSLAAVASTVQGTVTLTATPITSHPATLTYSYSQNGGTTYTNIAGCVNVSLASTTCSLDTTTLTDNKSTILRVQMVESSGQGAATLTATQTTFVENLHGVSVTAANGSGGTAGKIDASKDSISFTYSTQMNANSIMSGWGGSGSTVYVKIVDNTTAGTTTSETLTVYTTSALTTAVQLGSVTWPASTASRYVNTAGGTVVLAASMTLTNNSATPSGVVKLAFSSVTSGTVSGTAAAAATFTWTPSSSAKSLNLMSCSTTSVATASNRF